MKKLTLPILGALALSLSCSSVFAVDGTITVNGVITDGTCILQGSDFEAKGLKDITRNFGTIRKSEIPSPSERPLYGLIGLKLTNATGTGNCDLATIGAFKGIHLSVTSPTTDLDATDKTLLVNKAEGASGASIKNPIFMRIAHTEPVKAIDFSEPWGVQVISSINHVGELFYYVGIFSKTGVVDAQYFTATVNYTMHYN